MYKVHLVLLESLRKRTTVSRVFLVYRLMLYARLQNFELVSRGTALFAIRYTGDNTKPVTPINLTTTFYNVTHSHIFSGKLKTPNIVT